MAKLNATRGSASRIAWVFLPDSASSTGGGKTGLTNASAGLNVTVRREKSAAVTTYTGANIGAVTTLGTWVNPGTGKVNFKEVDATNLPGVYELHFVDVLFDASDTSRWLAGMVQATGIAPTPFELELDAFDLQTAKQSVSLAGADVSGTLPDEAGVTTLLARLTAGRATNLDSLDVAVSTRQQAGVAVTLPANPPAGFLVAASYGTAPAWYAAPDNTTLARLATALELSAGNYRFTVAALANAPAGGGGSGDWTAGELAQIRQALGVTGTVAVTSGAGVLDLAYAKLLTWSSAPTVAVAPVNPVTGDITLVRGDDYLAVNGRQLSWAAPTSGWPSLAGAAVNLYLGDLAPVAALAVGPPVEFELMHGQTAALAPGPGVPCVVRATLADGSVVTLARGHARVLP